MGTKVSILHTARVRDWAVANIPMPTATYHLETTVRLGRAGPNYTVVTDEMGGSARVWPCYLPRRRAMRQCARREAILAAVARSLPHTRPSRGSW